MPESLEPAATERITVVEQKIDALSTFVDQRFDALSASIDRRFDEVTHQFVEQREYTEFAFARLEKQLTARFDGLEQKFDGLEQKFDGLGRKVDGLERKVNRIDRLERKVDQILENQIRSKRSERRPNRRK